MTTNPADIDEQHLRELEHQTHEALLRGDTETVDQVLADEFLFTGADGRLVTKAEWLADMASGQTTYQSIRQQELQVRVFGDAAVTHGRVTMRGQSTGSGEFHDQYCYTCMYIRRHGRWQAIAEQATLLQPV